MEVPAEGTEGGQPPPLERNLGLRDPADKPHNSPCYYSLFHRPALGATNESTPRHQLVVAVHLHDRHDSDHERLFNAGFAFAISSARTDDITLMISRLCSQLHPSVRLVRQLWDPDNILGIEIPEYWAERLFHKVIPPDHPAVFDINVITPGATQGLQSRMVAPTPHRTTNNSPLRNPESDGPSTPRRRSVPSSCGDPRSTTPHSVP